MSEFFIVTSKRYPRHATLEEAREERNNLLRHFPGTTFFIHRCKASLNGARHFQKMVALLRDIVNEGLTPDNLARARVLLLTVGNRAVMPISENAPIVWQAPRQAARERVTA